MMFLKQLRMAWIPFAIFAICTAIAISHRPKFDGTGGSAVSGWVRDGRYYLSKGHGNYDETDAKTFAKVKRDEQIVLVAFGGMLASAVIAGLIIRRAGMPLHA